MTEKWSGEMKVGACVYIFAEKSKIYSTKWKDKRSLEIDYREMGNIVSMSCKRNKKDEGLLEK